VCSNEEEIGRSIRESGVAREDIFVVTKVQPAGVGCYDLLRAYFVSVLLTNFCCCSLPSVVMEQRPWIQANKNSIS